VFAQDSQSSSLVHDDSPTGKPVDRNRGTVKRLIFSENLAIGGSYLLIETCLHTKGNIRFHVFLRLFQNNTPVLISVAASVRIRCAIGASAAPESVQARVNDRGRGNRRDVISGPGIGGKNGEWRMSVLRHIEPEAACDGRHWDVGRQRQVNCLLRVTKRVQGSVKSCAG